MKKFLAGLTKFTIATILAASVVACGGKEERKQTYLEKGKTYLADKNYAKAKIEIKDVLQIDPKFAEAYYLMGVLEERSKEIRKAIGNYKKAIDLDPLHSKAKLKLAKIYVLIGVKELIQEAKKSLDEIIQQDPDNLEVKLVLATIEYMEGSREQAVRDIEVIVKKDANLIEGASLLANMYIEEKEYEKAKVLLFKAVKDNPADISLKIILAELFANDLGDLVSAEKYLLESVDLEPEDFKLQLALASFYGRTKQMDKAEAILKKSIQQDDEDIRRHVLLIELLAMQNGLKKAEAALLAAIEKKPELYTLKFFQAKFYVQFDRRDSAKDVLKKIIADRPHDVEGVRARNLLAKYLLDEGDQEGAKKYVDEVISEYPNDNDALLITSKLALMNLDAVSAINGLRTIVKNNPKDADASLLLAQAYELNKQSVLAENELKKAIEVNPVDERVHVNYARYLGSKGRIDDAMDVVNKALRYFKKSYDLLNIKFKIVASQGKDSEVIPLLNMMEKVNAGKAEVNITKGQYYLSKNKKSQAIEQFEKAYEKSQDKYKSLHLIVKTYLSNGQPEIALQRLQKLLDENSEDAVASLLMGRVYLAQKRVEDARVKFINASQSAKSWFLPYSSLASSYLLEKNTEKALAVYQNAMTNLKNKEPAQIKMAAIYERQKDFSSAMRTYKEILDSNSRNKLAANNYASLLLDHGNQAEAAKALELVKDFERLPQPALQDTLAWAYAKTGNNARAVEILKPIVEKMPKIAVFRYHLGYVLYEMGDKAAAKSHLEIAVSSKQGFPGKEKAKELLKSI